MMRAAKSKQKAIQNLQANWWRCWKAHKHNKSHQWFIAAPGDRLKNCWAGRYQSLSRQIERIIQFAIDAFRIFESLLWFSIQLDSTWFISIPIEGLRWELFAWLKSCQKRRILAGWKTAKDQAKCLCQTHTHTLAQRTPIRCRRRSTLGVRMLLIFFLKFHCFAKATEPTQKRQQFPTLRPFACPLQFN